jgi:hypothetical protein
MCDVYDFSSPQLHSSPSALLARSLRTASCLLQLPRKEPSAEVKLPSRVAPDACRRHDVGCRSESGTVRRRRVGEERLYDFFDGRKRLALGLRRRRSRRRLIGRLRRVGHERARRNNLQRRCPAISTEVGYLINVTIFEASSSHNLQGVVQPFSYMPGRVTISEGAVQPLFNLLHVTIFKGVVQPFQPSPLSCDNLQRRRPAIFNAPACELSIRT